MSSLPEPLEPRWTEQLREVRETLDKLDENVFVLLAQRRRLVHGLWQAKKAMGLPVHDPERERQQHVIGEARALDLGWPPEVGRRVVQLLLAAMHDPTNDSHR